jgi:N utilization substance protein A
MEAKLDMVLEQVGRDKNIDKSVLINALEQAILTAAKRTFGMNREMEAKFNPETGSVDLFLIVNVVEEDDAIEGREITVEQAKKAGLEAELGDELLFQVFYRAEDEDKAREQDEKFGEMIDLKNASKKFGRIAAQTAKQVIYQRVREAERDNVYNEYKDRKGEIITASSVARSSSTSARRKPSCRCASRCRARATASAIRSRRTSSISIATRAARRSS